MTHSSYANENVKFNERLEFLGARSGTRHLRQTFLLADYDEGQLTRLRARIVCKTA
ncbi:MAG: hypothetical protein ACLUEQ_13355 [Cloacibacillus evryensis]